MGASTQPSHQCKGAGFDESIYSDKAHDLFDVCFPCCTHEFSYLSGNREEMVSRGSQGTAKIRLL